MRRPSVLIVAYAFPPHSVVGAQRPMRLCKYLPRLTGWRPIVLSVRRTFARTDPGLLDEVPAEVPIYRARSWEPLRWLQDRRRPARAPAAGRPSPGPATAPRPRRAGPIGRFKKRLLDLLGTPDEQVGWVPAAVWTGLRIVRRHRPDLILVTAPPWSALIIGRLLGLLTRTPWVADYRDPWTDIDRGTLPAWRQRFERRLENRLLAGAAAVLSSSDRYTALMRDRFPDRPAEDFATLFNGFDEAGFAAPPPPVDDRFTITHLGSLYSYVRPEPVFAGLSAWLARDPRRRQRVRLQFIGRIDGAVRESLARLDLLEVTEEVGFLPHDEAIDRCRRSSVLLLAMGITPLTPEGWMPSKLYEYLAMRRPILAFTVRGEAAEAIERADAGAVVSSEDPTPVVEALEALERQAAAERTDAGAAAWPPGVRRFTQARIIPELAGILERTRRRDR